MKRVGLLLFACCLLPGCVMTKPGMTPQSKAQDRYACEQQANDSHARGFALDEMYRDCMRARGYR